MTAFQDNNRAQSPVGEAVGKNNHSLIALTNAVTQTA
jgi:hypothetical protein